MLLSRAEIKMSSGTKNHTALSSAENFVLGGLAAICGKTVAAPLERVKLLIQNEREMMLSQRLKISYNGPMDCLKRIISEEGILSLWRGNLANCLRYFPNQSLNFMFKDLIKAQFQMNEQDSGTSKLLKNTFSGSAAGLISLTAVYSLDFSRTRLANDVMSNQSRQFKGIWDVYKSTVRSDGLVGLYRGYVISCYTVIIYRGCYFGLYDTLKPLLFPDNEHSAHLLGSFGLGFGITTFAGMLVYPLDSIRRRMMMRSGENVKYKGSIDAATKIYHHEGVKAFYKGALVNVFRSCSGALTLALFDQFKRYWQNGLRDVILPVIGVKDEIECGKGVVATNKIEGLRTKGPKKKERTLHRNKSLGDIRSRKDK